LRSSGAPLKIGGGERGDRGKTPETFTQVLRYPDEALVIAAIDGGLGAYGRIDGS